MINFTIKTLDSNNHQFSVDDDITVQQLKEKVRDQMGIDPNLQRLIFCGRVLQDEKKLSEYNVNGKVVHLVQRAPPSPESRQSAPSVNNPEAMQQQIRRLMALNNLPDNSEPPPPVTVTPTTARLEFIRRLINEITISLSMLRNHIDGEENSGTPAGSDTRSGNTESNGQPPAEPMQEENESEADDTGERERTTRAQNVRRRARSLRARPRDLGLLLEELEALEEQFFPHRTNYIRLLRDNSNPETSQLTDDQRQHAQRTVDLTADLMHSFAHAYHAASDITFLVGQRTPRLTSEPTPARQPIPMQAHINVVQANRRPPQQPANNTNASSGTNATATQTSATAANSTGTNANSRGTPGGQATPHAGRNTTQPTVNINIQPDPVTYQVEIETRVPIAFPLENALLNGLTNAAAGNNQSTDQSQNQNGQQGQANRRQVLFDFENLFRGLGQAGGVEVVMSMEEIPQMGSMGTGGGTTGNSTPPAPGNVGAQPAEGGGGVYLSPMAWGGPPSADLLQNIVSSVIRQGLVPGMEGVAMHVPTQMAGPFYTTYFPNQPGGVGMQSPQAPGQPQAAPGTQPNQDQNGQEPRQPSLHLRRATTTTRAQAMSLSSMIYDRFLHCESLHARRRLQRRRELVVQQLAAQQRLRAQRAAAFNLESLRERNANLSADYIETMIRLLDSEPSRETWFAALMLTIARHLFLTEPMRGESHSGEPVTVPHEFQPLRILLRNFIRVLLIRSEDEDNGENAFQGAADYLVNRHLAFINTMGTIATLRPDVDILMSIRNLIRCRLPAVIASAMSESRGEIFAPRFYAVFGRVYSDLCAIITYCCEEGAEGFERIYAYFVEGLAATFEPSVRQPLVILSMENMQAVLDTLPYNLDSIRQYIQQREDVSEASSESSVPRATPMDVSPQIPVREEPMQTSSPGTPGTPATPGTPIESSRVLDLSYLEPMESIVEDPCLTCPIHASTSYTRFPSSLATSLPTNLPTSLPTSMPTSLPSSLPTSIPTSRPTNHAVDDPVPSSNRPPARTPKTEKSETTTSNGDDNVRFVPPMVIIQHWGEEWVPVFTRDQQAQRPDTQEPYSDAYLSGMPSRKRRCVRQTRSPTTLDGFLNESVREASERASTVDTSAIRVAFREHMRNLARNRASSSDDFDPLQYASAARFLNPPKRNNQQQPENGSDRDDA